MVNSGHTLHSRSSICADDLGVLIWLEVNIEINSGGAERSRTPLGRPRGTVGKAAASEARRPGFEPPWLVQRSRWEWRPLTLVGNGVGVVYPSD